MVAAPLPLMGMDGGVVLAAAAGGLVAGGAAVAFARRELRRRPGDGAARRGLLDRPALVAATTGLLWAGVAPGFGWSWPAAAAVWALTAGLVALAAADVDRHLLPRRLIYATGAAAGACILAGTLVSGDWGRLAVAAGAALVCAAGFALVRRIDRRGLGAGDVRLAGLLGLVLGWVGIPQLFVALLAGNLGGLLVSAVLLAAGRIGRRTPLPYGAFLAGGAIVAVLALPPGR